MNFDSNTPRRDITIQGVVVTAPMPFAEGHIVTANEAAALNQTLHENLRNNLATAFKDLVTAAGDSSQVDADAAQKLIDDYAAEYEFGIRRGGGVSLDPIEREAREIAGVQIKAQLKAKGFNLKDVGAEKINELIDAALEAHPQIRERAKQVVEIRTSVGADSLDIAV